MTMIIIRNFYTILFIQSTDVYCDRFQTLVVILMGLYFQGQLFYIHPISAYDIALKITENTESVVSLT